MSKRFWIAGLLSICGVLILSGGLFLFARQLHEHAAAVSAPACQQRVQKNTMSETKQCQKRLLLFSKTAGYRHDSIPDAIAALESLAAEHGVQVDATEDASVFTRENLARYSAVVFVMTSGHILDTAQQQAFEQYIASGGGYMGIHSASDTEYEWAWYGQLVGAFFKDHPHITQATVVVEDTKDLSTRSLPAHWVRTDEWYNFRTNPSKQVHVLLRVDEHSYQGGTMGADHPISWQHSFGGGRAWYTAMGHTKTSYSEPLFLAHLWGGVVYAAQLSENS